MVLVEKMLTPQTPELSMVMGMHRTVQLCDLRGIIWNIFQQVVILDQHKDWKQMETVRLGPSEGKRNCPPAPLKFTM